jgi:hypothetical protein
LAAFIGLAVLALLYFAQARDVRGLRERAAFVPEDGERPTEARAPARAATTAIAQSAEEVEAAAATDPRAAEQLEAARLAQIAREAAAERRARFERRTRGERGAGFRGRFELPEGGALFVVIAGVVLLVAGIAFGATRILGGDEEQPASEQPGGKAPVAKGEQPEVAVLNGTDVPGAAAETGAQLKEANYKLGPVTNTPLPFDTSVVMFDAGGEETANQVASALAITDVRPIDADTKSVAEGATVVVVVGADRAGGSEGGSTTGSTTGTESEF